MGRGRPRTPTNTLKLHGGINVTRHKDREHEPQPEGDAGQLAELKGAALDMWKHLHPQLSVIGLATELDSAELTALCEWWAEYRKWADDGAAEHMNPYRRITGMAVAYKQCRMVAAKFGLTPGDRASLGKVAKTVDDELGELIA